MKSTGDDVCNNTATLEKPGEGDEICDMDIWLSYAIDDPVEVN